MRSRLRQIFALDAFRASAPPLSEFVSVTPPPQNAFVQSIGVYADSAAPGQTLTRSSGGVSAPCRLSGILVCSSS